MKRLKLHLTLLTLFSSSWVFSQPLQQNPTEAKVNTYYNEHIGETAILYSGPSYVPQNYSMKGSPFLGSDTLTKGWIVYDGHLYPEILLQWDVLQNYVITSSVNEAAKIILRNDLIDSFFFAGHLIKSLPANREHNLRSGGLYDILYSGKTSLLSKRKKVSNVTIVDMSVVYPITEKSSYYVKMDDMYYLVSNKKDVLNLFHENKAGVKREVRRKHLKWRKNFEQALLISVIYFDKAHTNK